MEYLPAMLRCYSSYVCGFEGQIVFVIFFGFTTLLDTLLYVVVVSSDYKRRIRTAKL